MKTDAGAPHGSSASIYRELLRHSGVYGFGLLLSRIASLLLLPLYTSFLSPRDYGVIAILDLGTALLAQIALGGVHAAVLRESFSPKFKGKSENIWSTGLLLIALQTIPLVFLAWALRAEVSSAMFGTEIARGPLLIGFAAWMILPQVLAGYMQSYCRALKRSTLFVTMSVSGLVLRIILNVLFIALLSQGVLGFLYSSLIASSLEMFVYGFILFGRRPLVWLGESVGSLLRYGFPIMAAGLASLAMHQMDRGLLRAFDVDLSAIGLYALAYTIAQAGNTFVLEPFQAIWAPVMFEVDLRPDRAHVFRRVFIALVFAVFLVQTGLALASIPIIRLVAAPAYAGAADLLPWLCLAFFFFPLHTMFRIPVMLHRRTGSVAWIALTAAGINLLLNLLLIPRFHVLGACWASIATYAAFSFLGSVVYRRTENFHFPVQIVGVAILVGVGAYFGQRFLLPHSSFAIQVLGAIAFWTLAGMALLWATGWSNPKQWQSLWKEMRGGVSRA